MRRVLSRRSSGRDQVFRVTAARRGASDDIRRRERRYVITMLVRTACLLLAIFVPVTPLRIAFVVGAVVLPYFAVVFANGGREPDGSAPDMLEQPARTPLPPGPDGSGSPEPGSPPRHGSMS